MILLRLRKVYRCADCKYRFFSRATISRHTGMGHTVEYTGEMIRGPLERRLRRPCRRCGEYFAPQGRTQRYCSSCNQRGGRLPKWN